MHPAQATPTHGSDGRGATPLPRLRVGVTGARRLLVDQAGRIDVALGSVLARVRQEVGRAGDAGEMRLLSALARGVDRRAADQALALGYGLFVPMPFTRAQYELDFRGQEAVDEPALSAADDLAQFARLLDSAGDQWLALDGQRDIDRDRAYEAVGRFIVRHSDLLIGVWDHTAARGRGGTVDIVRYAAQVGVPIWWIHAADDVPPRWVIDPQDLHDGRHMAATPEACLEAYLSSLLRPPPPIPLHRHHWIGRLARLGQSETASPLQEYLCEQDLPPHWIWSVHTRLMQWASGVRIAWPPGARPGRADAGYWFDRFLTADARAGQFAGRYRSSHVWIVLFGLAALCLGALVQLLEAVAAPHGWAQLATMGELAVLMLMVGFVGAAIRNGWHERFIEHRLLAELCRKQQVLTYVGWAVENGLVRQVASEDRLAWVAWLFAAYQRAAPLPTGDLAEALQDVAWHAVIDDFVDQQLRYHDSRARMAERASHRFSELGGLCFAGVLACTTVKLLDAWFGGLAQTKPVVSLLATVLPGISGVFVGIGAFAELQMLADQSRHMARELGLAKERLERLRRSAPGRPLASQELGNQAAAAARLMLQDLDGWARLFRVKVIETS